MDRVMFNNGRGEVVPFATAPILENPKSQKQTLEIFETAIHAQPHQYVEFLYTTSYNPADRWTHTEIAEMKYPAMVIPNKGHTVIKPFKEFVSYN